MNTLTDDTRCVWMTSNVVEYRLCDKQFDCERCEFDRVMRNCAFSGEKADLSEKKTEEIDKIDLLLDGLMDEDYKDRLIYLPNSLVLDELSDQTFRLSLSSFAVHFLDNVFTVVPGRQGTEIRKGQPCLMLSGAWGSITVNSPIHFLYVDKSDDSIQRDQAHWVIGIIEAEKNEIARECLSQQEWQQQIIDLSRMLIQHKIQHAGAGRAADGGERKIQHLYQQIGIEGYLGMLKVLFRHKIKSRSV
ncbi:hypothetical protein JNM05_15435 [bacterium]|nr:hypothetical protein [bacterium]